MKIIVKTLSIIGLIVFMSSCTISKKSVSKLKRNSWVGSNNINYVTNNGIKIRYFKKGKGEPILLLHTMRTQIEYFKYLIPELTKHHTVYALDLPGHGFSDRPDTTYTQTFFHNTVKSFIKSQSLENLTIVGESFGGTISLTLGSEKDLSIKKIIALNPYDYGFKNDKKGGGIKRSNATSRLIFSMAQHKLTNFVIKMENKGILKKIFSGGFYDKKKMPSKLFNYINKTGKQKGFRKAEISYFREWVTWVDARKLYSNINVPVTLVYAQYDWSTLFERESNAKIIPNVELVEIQNSGHFSSLEQPIEVLKIILKK